MPHSGGGGTRLREHRVRMAMTQQDVAVRLEQLAWAQDERRVGVNADMVSKWERGLKTPSPFYIRLLCSLFSTTPDELGMRSTQPHAHSTPGGKGQDATVELLSALGLLGGGLTNVELLMPRLLELWKARTVGRPEILAELQDPSVGSLLRPSLRGLATSRPRVTDQESLSDLGRVTRHLEAGYHSLDSNVLMLPIRALIETVQDHLAGSARPADREVLLALLARANLLAGRVSFFDVGNVFEARSHLDLAREAAEECGDSALLAVVVGHMAFLPAHQHRFTAAASYLAAGHEVLRQRPGSAISAWLYAVESEIRSQAGDTDAAARAIDAANEGWERRRDAVQEPSWFDFFDRARLDGFEGLVRRHAGQLERAQVVLQGLAERAVVLGPKQSAVALLDLASVHLAGGDIDEACRLAIQAADRLRRTHYATGVERLVAFHQALPESRHPAARLLAEAISELLRESC